MVEGIILLTSDDPVSEKYETDADPCVRRDNNNPASFDRAFDKGSATLKEADKPNLSKK
jgi:hypothetical protein